MPELGGGAAVWTPLLTRHSAASHLKPQHPGNLQPPLKPHSGNHGNNYYLSVHPGCKLSPWSSKEASASPQLGWTVRWATLSRPKLEVPRCGVVLVGSVRLSSPGIWLAA